MHRTGNVDEAGTSRQVSFDTLGVETVEILPRFVPSNPRALQTYRSHQLHGVAELVNFQ